MMSLRFLCYSLCCWVWFIQILRFNLRVLAVSLPWFLAFTTLPRWKNATILLRPWPLQNRQHPRNFKKPLHQAHKPYSDLQLVQTVQCHFQCSDLQPEVEAPWVPNANMRQCLRMSQNVSAECFSVSGIADIAKQLGLKASSKASKAATNVSSEAMRSIDAICAVTRRKELFLDLCLYLVRHCSISQLDALESTPTAKEQQSCNGEIGEISHVFFLWRTRWSCRLFQCLEPWPNFLEALELSAFQDHSCVAEICEAKLDGTGVKPGQHICRWIWFLFFPVQLCKKMWRMCFFFTEVLRETNEPCESVCLVNPCMIGRPMSLWS